MLGDTLDLHIADIKKGTPGLASKAPIKPKYLIKRFDKNNIQITRDEEVKVFGDTLTSFLLFTAQNG